mmetsp:Transcript_36652/g.62942  ORF Transcript_36652/g.62942 Transcript_36652/m.62942 type:complete len:155 (+) Transcript_36652:22-486(+)
MNIRTQTLTKEQSRAISVLCDQLKRKELYESKYDNCIPPVHIIVENDNVTYIPRLVESVDIPTSNSAWFWNQAKKKQTVYLKSLQCEVVFWKLLSRQKKDQPSGIAYKIWMFHVKPINSNPFSVIWCEKGDSFPNFTHLDELQGFLDFMETNCK